MERQQRLLGGVGVGRLRIVDEQHPPQPADLFHAMGEAGKRLEGARNQVALDAQRPRRGKGESGVLPVMGAAKRARMRKIGDGFRAISRHHPMGADEDVGERRVLPRDRNDAARARARLEPRVYFPARLIVDADERNLGVRNQPLLDRRVVDKIAVPVEMVGSDVDQKADAGAKRGREIDLIGRAFDDMRAPRGWRGQIEDGRADVAAHGDVAPGLLQHMSDQRGGRRLAIGAGDRDEGRVRGSRAALADEELDIAHDRNPRRMREIDGPMRLGMSQRHARREHEQPEAPPVGVSEIDERNARSRSALASGWTVVPGRDVGAARDQRPRRRQPRTAEAEEGDALPMQG